MDLYGKKEKRRVEREKRHVMENRREQRMNRIKKGKTGAVIAVIGILVFGGIAILNYIKFRTHKDAETKKEEIIPVQVAELNFKNLKWILEQTGNIRPMVEVDVYPKIPGKIIEELLVEKGDKVNETTLIATLKSDDIQAQIEEALAVLESAKANMQQVQVKLDVIEKDRMRLEALYREKAVAKQKLDHVAGEYKAMAQAKRLSEAQIKSSNAILKQLEILHDDHRIYAPFSGYISARYVDRGARSSAMQPIVRVSKEEELKVVTTVTERDFPHIKKGMKVDIAADAFPEKTFTGEISVINPSIDSFTRTGEIEIHIQNKDLLLSSGMFAHLKLYIGEKKGLVVPMEALNRLPGTGNYYVYVIEDNKAIMKNIETGLSQGNYVEVTRGLTVNDKIVIKGQNRLRDGYPVRVEEQGIVENEKESLPLTQGGGDR